MHRFRGPPSITMPVDQLFTITTVLTCPDLVTPEEIRAGRRRS